MTPSEAAAILRRMNDPDSHWLTAREREAVELAVGVLEPKPEMTPRRLYDRQYNGLLEFFSNALPEDWKLSVSIENGEASMELHDPHWNVVLDFPVDGDCIDHWLFYINYARDIEDLPRIDEVGAEILRDWFERQKGGA